MRLHIAHGPFPWPIGHQDTLNGDGVTTEKLGTGTRPIGLHLHEAVEWVWRIRKWDVSATLQILSPNAENGGNSDENGIVNLFHSAVNFEIPKQYLYGSFVDGLPNFGATHHGDVYDANEGDIAKNPLVIGSQSYERDHFRDSDVPGHEYNTTGDALTEYPDRPTFYYELKYEDFSLKYAIFTGLVTGARNPPSPEPPATTPIPLPIIHCLENDLYYPFIYVAYSGNIYNDGQEGGNGYPGLIRFDASIVEADVADGHGGLDPEATIKRGRGLFTVEGYDVPLYYRLDHSSTIEPLHCGDTSIITGAEAGNFPRIYLNRVDYWPYAPADDASKPLYNTTTGEPATNPATGSPYTPAEIASAPWP